MEILNTNIRKKHCNLMFRRTSNSKYQHLNNGLTILMARYQLLNQPKSKSSVYITHPRCFQFILFHIGATF